MKINRDRHHLFSIKKRRNKWCLSLLNVAITLVFLCGVSAADVSTSLWQVKKSDHFMVYFQEAPFGYVDEVLSRAEAYYRDITEELGFTRYENFWTWEKRAKIYIYKDKASYRVATKQPDWSGANVQVAKRQIDSYINMEHFFDSILPHELGHIIFREFVGLNKRLPLWLDEGIVSFLEKKYRQDRMIIAKALIRSSSFMDLEELTKVKRVNIITMMPDVFYAEAYSIIEFLFAAYGRGKFVEFCRALRNMRDEEDWQAVLLNTYGLGELSELDRRWQEFLRKN